MQVRWFGQSAFLLTHNDVEVFIDPFGDMQGMASRGMRFGYPAITGVSAGVLLVTHEHLDHNAVEVIGGDPHIIRSRAGTHESPIGQVVAVASEHDDVAGTQRGPNAILVFTLGGVRVCHLGDLGQPALRPEQIAAIGEIDLLFVPVGGGPTMGGERSATAVRTLKPKWAVPMHYRTKAISFLEPADDFLERFERVERLATPAFETEGLPVGAEPVIVVPGVPAV